ncbi:hypothetical protein PUR61_23130 [Streptomyces sp. BE20]|uniref:hypothetical protein n=1 Tax=Streptomyces sp. BE20 TaxID=3002525 RepID=UPI002E79DEF8|nr:hypothetical protein [Streptomyces sp. BE20]MEE1825052.1 hypothetical protein [Streptomyces sp. BE20]
MSPRSENTPVAGRDAAPVRRRRTRLALAGGAIAALPVVGLLGAGTASAEPVASVEVVGKKPPAKVTAAKPPVKAVAAKPPMKAVAAKPPMKAVVAKPPVKAVAADPRAHGTP